MKSGSVMKLRDLLTLIACLENAETTCVAVQSPDRMRPAISVADALRNLSSAELDGPRANSASVIFDLWSSILRLLISLNII